MSEDDEVVDSTDDFEVYERKKKRDPMRDAFAPEQGGQNEGAPPVDADDSDEPARLEPGFGGLGDDVVHDVLDRLSGPVDRAETHDNEAAGETFTADDLPDPPTEPMKIAEPTVTEPDGPSPLSRFTEPAADVAAPASSTTVSSSVSVSSSPRGSSMRIAFAVSEFNHDITQAMLERATSHAEFLGAQVGHIVRVPGVYDLPLAVKRLLAREDVDAVVTLGVVIEGETDHDDLVIQHAARKIVDLSLEASKPAGLGITGPGMSRLQAMARVDRAKEAVEAVVKLGRNLAEI